MNIRMKIFTALFVVLYIPHLNWSSLEKDSFPPA